MKRLALITSLYLLGACATLYPKLEQTKAAVNASAPRIIVLRSSESNVYDGPIAALLEQVEGEVLQVTVNELVARPALTRAILATKPDFIVSFGPAASTFAVERLASKVPVLFSMVLNHRNLVRPNAARVAGISLETSPLTEFSQYKLVLPKMRRVVGLYSPGVFDPYVERARLDLAKLDIELQPVPVESAAELDALAQRAFEEDTAVWLMGDPTLLKREIFERLQAICEKRHVPLLASLSEQLASEGALMAMAVDFTALGAQAALIVNQVLGGELTIDKVALVPAIGSKLIVNEDVAKRLDITINEEARALVETVQSEPSPRSKP